MLRRSVILSAMLMVAAASAASAASQVATFAAGCYWCVESDFDKIRGVTDTTPGFMGGDTPNPTYEQVSAGTTGHTEVVNITFDPAVVTYKQLLDHFWVNVDPLDKGGQFCDRGSQYRPGIFYRDDEQKKAAEESKSAIEKSGQLKEPIVIEITQASAFTAAPDPDYYKNNPIRYKFYRAGCGRDARLKQLWGDKAGQ